MRAIVTVAAGLLALVPSVTWAAEPVPLQPTTDWILDYGEERCTLTRGFGEGDQAVRLQIDSHGTLEAFMALLAGPAIPESRDPIGTLSLQMTPDEEPRRDILAIQGKTGQLDSVSFSLDFAPAYDLREYSRKNPDEQRDFFRSLRPLRPAFERETRNLVVRFDAWKAIDLRTGRMTAPLAALRDCARSLWASWGIDPVVQENLSRPSVMSERTRSRIGMSFPAAMIGRSALIPVRIMVAADGTASGCTIQSDIVPAVAKVAVCDGLAGEFEPAQDAQGQATRALFHTYVLFTTHLGNRSGGAGLKR